MKSLVSCMFYEALGTAILCVGVSLVAWNSAAADTLAIPLSLYVAI